MNLATEPAQLRRLAQRLEQRGRDGDRELARRARLKAVAIELGDTEPLKVFDEAAVAQMLDIGLSL